VFSHYPGEADGQATGSGGQSSPTHLDKEPTTLPNRNSHLPKNPAKKRSGLPSHEELVAFIGTHKGKAGVREIARAFGLKNNDRATLKHMLRGLENEGKVEKRRKKLHHAGTLPAVVLADVTHRDSDGELIAVPTEWDSEAHGEAPRIRIHVPRKAKPIEIPGVGDRALLRTEESGDEGEAIRHSGRVIKVLDRAKQRQLGIFRAQANGGGRLEPVDKKQLGREVHIPPGATAEAKDGDLVAVELTRQGRFGLPTAQVKERLGSLNTERAASFIAIHAHEIPHVFRRETLIEADEARPAGLAGREDLRKLALVTIDPADAKDHDDAVHAEPDGDPSNTGGFIVTVAIADVAHYVTPGSALDREALVRGNSVYFPDQVVPMLPERISNDLCSLRPGEDRAALAVRMVIGSDGRKRSHSFHRVLMRSAAKLNYAQVQAAIDGRPDDTTGSLLGPVIEPLYAAYRAVKRARDERQPLDLDLPERKIVLKADGTVDRVITPPRLDAHRLIEEFMILANVAAPETLERARVPLIYRVHDEPSPEKLEGLREFLATIDINLAKGQVMRPADFNKILVRVKGTEHETLVNEVVLRSQAQAEYSAENYGHFGLNLRRYAHFTSPIRRYADLVVHRALIRAQNFGADGLPDRMDVPALNEVAARISAAERRAMKAERETVDRLIAHFLADRVGATFEGRISGVTRAGLFCKLDDTGADGFIPARTLGADYFRYHEGRHALIGDHTGEAYRLGDRVTVKLVEAAPVAGALRFELLSEGRYDGASKKGQPARAKRYDRPKPGKRAGRRR
jgi:ribonuclease R